MAPDAKVIEEQLVNGLAGRLEAALEIVASAQMAPRLQDIADLCHEAAILAQAGKLMLNR